MLQHEADVAMLKSMIAKCAFNDSTVTSKINSSLKVPSSLSSTHAVIDVSDQSKAKNRYKVTNKARDKLVSEHK